MGQTPKRENPHDYVYISQAPVVLGFHICCLLCWPLSLNAHPQNFISVSSRIADANLINCNGASSTELVCKHMQKYTSSQI